MKANFFLNFVFNFSWPENGISVKACDFFCVHEIHQNLIKISVQKFWSLLGTKKGSCHFNWKIHICHQQLSALHVSAVKVFQVVKEMWDNFWFLYGGSKSHPSTTLIHKRFLPEMCMNENPLTLWCCCFNGGGLGFLRVPVWPREIGSRGNAEFEALWSCGSAAGQWGFQLTQ